MGRTMNYLDRIKSARTTAEKQDATRDFIARDYRKPLDADTARMLDAIVPRVANCADYVTDESALEIVANGMRNCYYDGMLAAL